MFGLTSPCYTREPSPNSAVAPDANRCFTVLQESRSRPAVRAVNRELLGGGRQSMGRVSVKGLLVGGVLDIVLSMILGIPLAIYAMATAHLPQMPPDQLSKALAASIHSRPILYVMQLLIGVASTAFGGYVAAWIAKRNEVLNGLLSSLVCVAVGVFSLASGKQHETALMQVVLFTLTFAAGAFGGYVRSRRGGGAASSPPSN